MQTYMTYEWCNNNDVICLYADITDVSGVTVMSVVPRPVKMHLVRDSAIHIYNKSWKILHNSAFKQEIGYLSCKYIKEPAQ